MHKYLQEPNVNYGDINSSETLQQQLSSPPSQSSTLKMGTDLRKNYQTAPLLYDALPPLNRHDINARYDPLNGINMNSYAGGSSSNSTLSSGTGSNNGNTLNASHNLMNGGAGLQYAGAINQHHTLPHPNSNATLATTANAGLMQTNTLPSAAGEMSIADYLTASSLIDYNLSKSAAAGGLSSLTSSSSSSNNTNMGHMTLPKGMGMGSIMGVGSGGGGGMPMTPSSQHSIASTITQKTNNSSRNHIITDTLPGPESCV